LIKKNKPTANNNVSRNVEERMVVFTDF
jgi:hypothetical protein